MKINNCLQRRLLAALGCTIFLMQSGLKAADSVPQPMPSDVAGNCQVSIIETAHLKFQNALKHPTTSLSPASCRISMNDKDHVSGQPIGIRFSGFQDSNGIGAFTRSEQGQWRFEGNNILLDGHFLKRTLKQEQNGDELLLIGIQLVRGKIAQGGPMDVPGISIARITPQFVVTADLNFEPTYYEKQTKGYKQLREAVTQELIDIVKSVQPTPGEPGPTVRQ